MSDLTHIFKVDQKVKCNLDGAFYDGTVKEISKTYVIVDIPGVSDHCMFETGVNMDCIYPDYNFE